MGERWRAGTVEGNDGRPVRVWRRGDWIIAQDVNVGGLRGVGDRWGFTLARVVGGEEQPADVHTEYGTACWSTRREAEQCAATDPPTIAAATARARAAAAHVAALNARVRRLTAMLRGDTPADGGGAHAATDAVDPGDMLADLDALAEYLGARRRGVAAVAAALLFACESAVEVEDHGDAIVLTFDGGREWSREVRLAWPFTEARWSRDIGRADEGCTEARERHEEGS